MHALRRLALFATCLTFAAGCPAPAPPDDADTGGDDASAIEDGWTILGPLAGHGATAARVEEAIVANVITT